MIRVRPAVQSDSGWLLAQLRAFSDYYGGAHSVFPANEDSAHEKLSFLIDSQVVLIAEKETSSILPGVTLDHERQGLIIGMLVPNHLNPDRSALVEFAWWVAPEHRGSSAGARLLKTFIDHGKRLGAHWIQMSLLPGKSIDPTSLERQNFKHTESIYVLENV